MERLKKPIFIESPKMGDLALGEINYYCNNVELNNDSGVWALISVSHEQEMKMHKLEFKRSIWNFIGMILLVFLGAFNVIVTYDIRDEMVVYWDGVLMIFMSFVLFGTFWVHWYKNNKYIIELMRAILAASICVDVFIFAKNRDLGDESILGRAESYVDALSKYNQVFKSDWFDLYYILPDTFEKWEDYEIRVKKIVFSTVKNTEKNMKKNDKDTFVKVNARQIKKDELI